MLQLQPHIDFSVMLQVELPDASVLADMAALQGWAPLAAKVYLTAVCRMLSPPPAPRRGKPADAHK